MSISRATVDSLTAINDGSGVQVGSIVKVKTDGSSTAVPVVNPGYGVFVGDRVYVDALTSKDAKGGKLILVGTTPDNMHIVGNTGEIGFLNSWVQYTTDALHTPARYTRDALGIVRLSGAIMNGTTGNQISGTGAGVAFVLPAKYRPTKGHVFEGFAGNTARINVNADGGVCVAALFTGSTNAYVSISGIVFKAEQ